MDSDMAISSANTFRRIELITGVGRRWTSHEKASRSERRKGQSGRTTPWHEPRLAVPVASTGPGELLYAETSRESRACGNSDAGPPQALTAFVPIWACNATCQFSDAAWTAAKALTTIAVGRGAATRHKAVAWA